MSVKKVNPSLVVSAMLMACCLYSTVLVAQNTVRAQQWKPVELAYVSAITYANPVDDVELLATFVAPSGKQHQVAGFWDGGNTWKIRFMPDAIGWWSYTTHSSDMENKSLHKQSGKFRARRNTSSLAIYSHGKVGHAQGNYHISHADGTPFFYLGCTAWNGALRATQEEWPTYLQHRQELMLVSHTTPE